MVQAAIAYAVSASHTGLALSIELIKSSTIETHLRFVCFKVLNQQLGATLVPCL
jgi:hypothetical protein